MDMTDLRSGFSSIGKLDGDRVRNDAMVQVGIFQSPAVAGVHFRSLSEGRKRTQAAGDTARGIGRLGRGWVNMSPDAWHISALVPEVEMWLQPENQDIA
jgi:hypothetical protein